MLEKICKSDKIWQRYRRVSKSIFLDTIVYCTYLFVISLQYTTRCTKFPMAWWVNCNLVQLFAWSRPCISNFVVDLRVTFAADYRLINWQKIWFSSLGFLLVLASVLWSGFCLKRNYRKFPLPPCQLCLRERQRKPYFSNPRGTTVFVSLRLSHGRLWS